MNASDCEEADVDQNAILTGFLFGNINESGHLEDDFLDEECRNRIGNLATLCGEGLVKEITDERDEDNYDEAGSQKEDEDLDDKTDGAEDFFDINEALEVEENQEVGSVETWKTSATRTNGVEPDDDYDEEERPQTAVDKPGEPRDQPQEHLVSNKPMMQTPLASVIPAPFMNIDVRCFFPEFKLGVLRFNKMIPPAHHPNIWKKKKKKKVQEERPNDSRRDGTFHHSGSGLAGDDRRGLWKQARSPTSDEIEQDESELIMQEDTTQGMSLEERSQEIQDASIWRHGPSRMWYDGLGVAEDGKGFSYANHGFKLRETAPLVGPEEPAPQPTSDELARPAPKRGRADELDEESEAPPMKRVKVEIPDEAHLMVSQYHWEDDIIRNGEEVKSQVLEELGKRVPICGWIPTATTRSFKEYIEKYHPDVTVNHRYSILPMVNHELANRRWIDDIIWDAQEMDGIPEPRVLTLDKNDENLILRIPDESEIANQEKQHLLQLQQQQQQESAGTKKEKEMKKSKSGPPKMKEDDETQEETEMQQKHHYNMSNDEYYNPKLTTDNALGRNLGVSMILHSTPALELMQPFFPCHLTLPKLRNFHRPHLKKYSRGAMVSPGPHPVMPLVKYIRRKEKLREQERLAAGGGDIFFMRTPDDLTGRDGEIILAEYSEQYPPLLNQIGMATKVKNYYKRKPGNYESDPPQFTYGELAYAHTSPFLGSLQPGQSLQAFENNMFRAPIYSHKTPMSDFLVVRNRNNYYIREVDGLFAIGQECPLMEVPCPGSKKANTFQRDFLQLFIYRLFWMSNDSPRRIKMEEVRKAFPYQSESSVRKRLKLCADFKRTGIDSNWWVLKHNARLPSEEELREMVSPEQCCAYYSMQAARQRLNDAGYPDKSLIAAEEDAEETSKMDDEPKAAPWQTTAAYISAMKGKCLLQLNGFADPTGCGEGFSYVKIPNKPQPGKDDQSGQSAIKRSVMGTDADLRRLPLKKAKLLLRKLGVDEATVNKLGRWEVIDQIRTRSTEQAKSSQDGSGICKFARGNRFSMAEYHERYKEECQRIFDLQNKILASDEVLSSDEEWSSAEESDLEEMGKNIENMLSSKKTTSQLSLEKEEAERKELNKIMKAGDKQKKDKKGDASGSANPSGNRKLKITRKFRGEDGREYTRVEIVKKQNIIDRYIRIKESKDKSYLQQFSVLDEQQKEEMKREKKRLQEQLRRIKRMEDGNVTDVKKKSKSSKPLKPNKLKCGACGQTGHMRTNRECPKFSKSSAPSGAVGNVALSEEQQEELEKTDLKDEALINIEGTKVTLSKQLIKHAEDIKKKSLVLKFPKVSKEEKKRKLSSLSLQDEYLKKPKKLLNRRRADPVVTLSTIFEDILNEMRELPCSIQFLFPVNAKLVSDYYDVIKKPMCLQTIRENLRSRKYQSREDFLVDVNQIVRNCELYNGANSPLTASARQMFEHCLQRIAEKEDKLMKLEKAINPLLDDDDMVSFSYILTSVIEDRLKTIEGSVAFHTPVNKKQYKDYYMTIDSPMDLSTMHRKASEHQYFSREDFLKDVYLLVSNCQTYNGPHSLLTATANKILEVCMEALEEQDQTLLALEQNIAATREAAFEAVETDSIVTGDNDESSRAPKFTIGDESSLMSMDYGGRNQDDDAFGDELEGHEFRVDPNPFSAFGRSKTESDMLSALQQELEISESDSNDETNTESPSHGRSIWDSFGRGDIGLEDGEIAEDSEILPQDLSGAGDIDDQDMDVD